MSTVGYATLDVIPSVKGLAGELQKQTGGDLTRAGKVGGKRYGDAAGSSAAGGFKSKFGGAMKGFAPLAGLVGTASIVAGLKGAVDGASDLSESTSKVNTVFGEASASVLKFADNAAVGFGQSEAQALEATGTFGNLLRSVGLTEDVSAKFSTTMVGLASDLASFNNTDVDEALTALRSGLVGETEPLKRFGVNLNDATLKAKALELGLSDGKATLDANAKAQAGYALIMEQTSLAQGDFARTSGGLANQSKILGAQWTELTTTVGAKLLPAVTGFVSFMNDDGIPALASAGGAAKDLASAVGDLPTPVKTAAAAFVLLRVASATGLSATIVSGAGSARGAIDSLRIRTLLAADAFRSARTTTRAFAGTTTQVSSGVGRATASLNALRVGAQGAGTALNRGLKGAVGMLGGPWGIALIAGTALLGKFWSEHREAKQHIDDLAESLDKQTGAITDNTRETVVNALEKDGVLKSARELGLSLDVVTDAALGNTSALARLRDAQDAASASGSDWGDGNNALIGSFSGILNAVGAQTGAIADAREESGRLREAMGSAADATDESADSTADATREYGSYRGEIQKVRGELQKLIDKEQERALKSIQNRRDQIALRETLKSAREEAADGKKTLNENTAAGRENMSALLDLADQWATSTPKVTNAKGAYEGMRSKFVEVATQMGATKAEAKKLADELLKVPKKVGPKFQSEGYRELLAEIAAIKAAASELGPVGIDFTPRGFGAPASVGGGPVSPTRTDPVGPATSRAGVNFTGPITVQATDPDDFLGKIQRRARSGQRGGRPTT